MNYLKHNSIVREVRKMQKLNLSSIVFMIEIGEGAKDGWIALHQLSHCMFLHRQHNSLVMFWCNLSLFPTGCSISAMMVLFDDQLFLILTKLYIIAEHHHLILISEYGSDFFQGDTFRFWECPRDPN